jgi:cardiolipin synthase
MKFECLFAATAVVAFSACSTTSEKKITHPIEHRHSVQNPAFRQELDTLLGPSIAGGNRITTLVNGDEIFPAVLEAIRGARKSITFETYVFWKGEAADALTEALVERARAGVEVKVILDSQGASKVGANISQLQSAGATVHKYHSVFWWDLRRYNNRTHRKLLVIDGKVGFIGGLGIADLWLGHADSPKHWRDTHYRVEGPVVAQLQAAFQDNWLKTKGDLLNGETYFPALPSRGGSKAQVFGSSPHEGSININLMYQLAISSATKSLLIENAYFLPDRQLVDALCAAAKRGVKVQIIVPGRHIDQKMVRRASRTKWKKLLVAGVKLFEYQPTMIHCKLMIVDGLFVSVGSANFDIRSLRLNDEANMNVLDARFAAGQTRIFQRDRQNCKPIVYNEEKNRLIAQPFDQSATVFSSQL